MEVSIVITNYNYGEYLERCIRSCQSQVFDGEYEIIVVDDCSTDHSSIILEMYGEDSIVNVILNQDNMGVAGSANVGIKAARGQFVVRVDADDYVNEYFILFLSKYLRDNSDLFCASCDYYYVNNEGEKYERLYAENAPVSCGIMYRKDFLNKHGLYNSQWRHREEEELRKRIGDQYKLGHLQMPLYRYRKHGQNKTEQKDMMELFKRKLKKIPHPVQEVTDSAHNKEDYIVAIIPARIGSKRLKNKNILKINEKPMIQYAIDAALDSKYVSDVFVTTESELISIVAEDAGAKVIKRPEGLSADNIIKQDVIIHAVKQIEKIRRPDVVISLQANSPQITQETLDNCVEQLYHANSNEVMTVDENMIQNAAVRVMRYTTVFQNSLSTYFSVYPKNIIDVHTLDDFNAVKKQIK
jgi:glycosyltransferase involved in cell wall biosynthesis